MATKEISQLEFESIVDKLEIKEVSINVYSKTKVDVEFPIVDIGINTHCESSTRKVTILRFVNEIEKQNSDKIRLTYNPFIAINRDCLFVKPDDVIQHRLESILDDADRIKFFFYDVSHPNSMINMFKDHEIYEDIDSENIISENIIGENIIGENINSKIINLSDSNEKKYVSDVVIIFYNENIQAHLKYIETTYKKPFIGIGQKTIDPRKQKIINVLGFNYKYIILILFVVTVFYSFSISYIFEDISSDLPINLPQGNDNFNGDNS